MCTATSSPHCLYYWAYPWHVSVLFGQPWVGRKFNLNGRYWLQYFCRAPAVSLMPCHFHYCIFFVFEFLFFLVPFLSYFSFWVLKEMNSKSDNFHLPSKLFINYHHARSLNRIILPKPKPLYMVYHLVISHQKFCKWSVNFQWLFFNIRSKHWLIFYVCRDQTSRSLIRLQ